MNSNLKKIVMTALFAALACVATMSIRIPTPGTGGYIHPGDAIVILSGVVLGPSYGLLAAGIGSAMSDLLGGYFVYVPITFVIKGLIALFSGLVYQKIAKDSKTRYVAVLLGGVIDIVLVAGGYFICEFFLYGSSAAASIPANIIQGVGGLIISFVLYPVLMAIPDVKKFFACVFYPVHGIASLLANNSMEYDEDEFDHVISMIKRGVLKELESENDA